MRNARAYCGLHGKRRRGELSTGTPTDHGLDAVDDIGKMAVLETVAGRIEQEWRHGESSHGTTHFRLDAQGHLTVAITVYDSNFEGPLRYATTYRREAPEP